VDSVLMKIMGLGLKKSATLPGTNRMHQQNTVQVSRKLAGASQYY